MGRCYRKDLIEGMKAFVVGGVQKKGEVKLIGNKYIGTKVMPFTTFGVTAAIVLDGKTYIGNAVAPKATSGGVREPLAAGSFDLAKKHLEKLEKILNSKTVNILDPFAVEDAVLKLDRELSKEEEVGNDRPTTAIGSDVALSATTALLEAQAAYMGLPIVLAMRAVYLNLLGEEQNIKDLEAPLPKFNILNFGVHSSTKRPDKLPYIQLQETKVAPIGAENFGEAVKMGVEILERVIELAKVDNIGFEAGISPPLKSPEDVYKMSLEAIEKAGLTGKVALAADAAASEFSYPEKEGSDKYLYDLYPGEKPLDADGMVKFWEKMYDDYKILSIEDGMHSEDETGWKLLMAALGDKMEIQGDDLYVTAEEEIDRLNECANSVLIKPNQAGTLLRTIKAIVAARKRNKTISPSHRSGKVPGGYGIIPELCLATNAEWIKPGAPRRERAGFLNNVTTLMDELKLLSIPVGYAGPRIAKRFRFKVI